MSGSARAEQLGRRVRHERVRRGLTLEALGSRANVSASMLSAVERGVRVPTVLVLDRIATAMGTSIARLLRAERDDRIVLLRREDQDVAVDRSGWERRVLSPVLPGVEFELMRTTLGAGVDAGVFDAHLHGSREYVAIESGALLLTLDGEEHRLGAGDAIFYAGDCAHGFTNASTSKPCVYYLAMELAGHGRPAHRRRPANGGMPA